MAAGDFPFGFSGSGDPDKPDDDLAAKIPLFTELEKLLSWQGGPVNWDLARQIAIKTASTSDAAVSSTSATSVAEALRLADLWLDDATTLPSGTSGGTQAWTRVRWVEATLPVWRTLIDPVAERVSGAMGETLQTGLRGVAENGLPPEMRAMLPPELAAQLPQDAAGFQALLGPMMGMLGQVGGLLFGSQIGQALGTLATDVLASSEVGLPLAPDGVSALVPANVEAFGTDLDVPLDEITLYLALRETAAARLFAHVPWLRSGLLSAVEEYARGIRVDPEQLQRSVESFRELDPSDPEALTRAIGGELFDIPDTPEQQRALARLETLLALVEGWIDAVTQAAAGGRLPHADALRETVRRRRAVGGPSEQTFSALVGLTLRPRRLREAAAVWEALTETGGVDERDALWEHPDLLPGPTDLDDPQAFVRGREAGGENPVAVIEALAAAQQRAPVEGAPQPSQAEQPGDAGPDNDEPDDAGPDGDGPDPAGAT
jgi:putative hydrolase